MSSILTVAADVAEKLQRELGCCEEVTIDFSRKEVTLEAKLSEKRMLTMKLVEHLPPSARGWVPQNGLLKQTVKALAAGVVKRDGDAYFVTKSPFLGSYHLLVPASTLGFHG